jgi:septum site-determining protein MinD
VPEQTRRFIFVSEAIVFTSGKGGVGKTTVISNIGVELSQLDKKVIMLDTDMGLRNLDLVMGIEDKVNYNILDILNRSCRIRQAIIRNKKYPNLYVIPAAPSMDTLCSYEARFKILIEELKASFDYCLIDSPAGIDSGFWFSVSPADRAIVVTTPHVSAIHDARRCISLLDSAHLDDISVIVNAYDKHMVRRHQMISDNDITALLSTRIIGTIPYDKSVIICQNRGIPVREAKSKLGPVFARISGQIIHSSDDMKGAAV